MKESSQFDLVSQIVNIQFAELSNSRSYSTLLVLIIAAIFFVQDIYTDYVVEDESMSHILIEGGIFLVVLLALGSELKRVINLSSSLSNSQQIITSLKKHLTRKIREEFDHWRFTQTEKDIALLLIKGLSMQEIADLRYVKEKSVRQQATKIYLKARVSNRYELTSYFIVDLFIPEAG